MEACFCLLVAMQCCEHWSMDGRTKRKSICKVNCRCFCASFARRSEGQIVGCTFAGRLLCGREGSRCTTTLWSSILLRSGCKRSGLWNRLSHLAANDVVGTNVVEPTSLPLTCVNVELNGDFFARLYVKLLDAILSKDVEDHPAGILSWYFDYILLRHPGVACASRCTASWLQDGNHFSC